MARGRVEGGGRAIPVRVSGPAGDGTLPAGGRRLLGVDAFRGGVLALMLLTPPIGPATAYPWLRHSPWDGVTVSDLIFPAFLVTSGASLAFLLRPPVTAEVRWRLVRRVLALLVLGLFYNAFGTTGADLSTLRLTGVLQLIGLSGGLAAAVVLASRRWAHPAGDDDRPLAIAAVALGLVAVNGLGLAAGSCRPPAGAPGCSPWFIVDATLLGEAHLYGGGSLGYDPEGVAPVVAATGLVLVGYLAGWWLRRATGSPARPARPAGSHAVPGMALASTGLLVAGLLLDQLQPINKRIHSPAFSLVAAGGALAGLALFTLVLDRPARSRAVGAARQAATAPLLVLGRNALVVYLGERVLLQLAAHTRVGTGTLQDWLLVHIVSFGDPAAYLGYGALVLLAVLAIATVMHLLQWRIAL